VEREVAGGEYDSVDMSERPLPSLHLHISSGSGWKREGVKGWVLGGIGGGERSRRWSFSSRLLRV
jgi:hypothetical protein